MTDSEKINILQRQLGQIIAQSDALGNIKIYCTFYSGDIQGFKEKIADSIQLLVQWGFPADKKHPAGSWRKIKPDTDNLQKMLKDALTEAGFWEDDCLVVSETVQKFYVDTPGIYIAIAKVE